MPLDPSYKLIFGQGGSIEATSDLDEMTERVRELSGDENAEGFRKYVKENRRKLLRSKSSLQSPWKGPLDLLSRKAMEAASVLCLLYTSPSPRDGNVSRMPSSA